MTMNNVIASNIDLKNTQIGNYNTIKGNVNFGDRVKIGNNCTIIGNIYIGDNTEIENNVVLINNVKIGKNNKIFSGGSIGYPAQHLKEYDISEKFIIIGDNNIIRENITLHLPFSKNETKICNNCYFMANTHIPHDALISDYVVIANNVAIGGHSTIGKYAFIGLNSCIHQFSLIGDYSMIAMGSSITRDVLPFHLCAATGNDAKLKINIIGFERNYAGSITKDELLIARDNIQKNKSVENCTDNPELQKYFYSITNNSQRGCYL